MNKKYRILVAPLDWGLGHASRCIPLIRKLQKNNFEVIIAADRMPLKLLQETFPELESIILKGAEIRYSKHLPMSIGMLLKLPSFYSSIQKEISLIDDLVENYQIDAIISDNRYGLHSSKVLSILITHQLFVQVPLGTTLVNKLIHTSISQFDECWVPDFEGIDNSSGILSHQKMDSIEPRFIGPLSRFERSKNESKEFERELMVILSGPEPLRSNFEKKVTEMLQVWGQEVLVVRGLVGDEEHTHEKGGIQFINHLSTERMKLEIEKSKYVLCRSGYSSIMDLLVLGKQAIIVPTPGQTEQEYLAEYLKEKKWFYSAREKELNLVDAMVQVKSYQPPPISQNNVELENAINWLTERLSQ